MSKTEERIEQVVEDLRKNVMAKWDRDVQNEFFLTEYNDKTLIQYHHGLGTWIRNKYKLWDITWEPELIDGVDYSPNHPDAISMTIIKEVWKRGPIKNI